MILAGNWSVEIIEIICHLVFASGRHVDFLIFPFMTAVFLLRFTLGEWSIQIQVKLLAYDSY